MIPMNHHIRLLRTMLVLYKTQPLGRCEFLVPSTVIAERAYDMVSVYLLSLLAVVRINTGKVYEM